MFILREYVRHISQNRINSKLQFFRKIKKMFAHCITNVKRKIMKQIMKLDEIATDPERFKILRTLLLKKFWFQNRKFRIKLNYSYFFIFDSLGFVRVNNFYSFQF